MPFSLRFHVLAMSVLFCLFTPLLIFAQDQESNSLGVGRTEAPTLELGLGIFAYNFPFYRGSDHRDSVFLPFPYFVYRSKYINADNSAMRGQIYDSGRFRIGLSIIGAFRVDSEKTKVRQGMPALDPMVELGPVFSYDLWYSDIKDQALTLGIPVRTGVALNFFRAGQKGFFIMPYLAYTHLPAPRTLNTQIQLSAGPMFATYEYNAYYYSVAPTYATSSRPAYDPPGGYSGFHTMIFLTHQWPKFYGFLFSSYDHLEGASFRHSPLVQRKDFLSIGGGLVWYFFQSTSKELYNRLDRSL